MPRSRQWWCAAAVLLSVATACSSNGTRGAGPAAEAGSGSGANGNVGINEAAGAGGNLPIARGAGAGPFDGGMGARSAQSGRSNSRSTAGGERIDGGPNTMPIFEGENDALPYTKPAPRATCQAGDMSETGIQGLGENVQCNLDVVGKVAATNFMAFAWWDSCAYVNDTNGTYVIDVSDESHPKNIKTLTTPGMQNNWESMKVSAKGLLVGYESQGAGMLDVYDVTSDCRNPAFKKSLDLGGIGHAGNFSPDGTIYYASSLYTSTIYAVDVMNPGNPFVITSVFTDSMNAGIGTHDLNTGKNGTRGYFTYVHLVQLGSGSLGIVDLTDIQARKPNAKGTLISEVDWNETNTTQYPIPLTYGGRDFLFVTDELGSGSCPTPYSYGRMFDIGDEKHPKLVSLVKTEAEDPANCQAAVNQAGGPYPNFGVGVHYCSVDRRDDPRVLACAHWFAGLRLYDIRNPYRPKELAYIQTGKGEQVVYTPRIMLEQKRIWTQTNTTFYVLKLADAVVDSLLAGSP